MKAMRTEDTKGLSSADAAPHPAVQQQQQLQRILDNTHEAIFQLDLEGQFLFANAAVERLSGYTPEALLQMNMWTLVVQDYHTLVRDRLQQRIAGAVAESSLEVEIWRKDRQRVWLELNISSVKDSADRLVAVQGVARDVTQRKRAEVALHASKQYLQHIIDSAREVIFQLDLQGRFVFINATAEKFSGYTTGELLQMRMLDVVAPDHHALVRDRLRQRIAGNIAESSIEFELTHKDGHRLWAELTTSGVVDAAEQLVAVQGVVRDITARKRAELAVQTSKHYLQRIIDNTQEIIFQVDLQGRFIFANAAATRLSGYTPEQLVQMHVLDVVAPDHHALMRTRLQERAAGNVAESSVEFEIQRQDATRVWAELTTSGVVDAAGQLVAVQGVVRDISERKRAELAVQGSQQHLQRIIDNTREVIFQVDLQGRFIFANATAERLSGYTPGQLLSMRALDVVAPEYHELVRARMQQRLDGNVAASSVEFEIRRQDASRVWVELTTNGMVEAEGQLVAVQGVVRDISERKQTEAILRARLSLMQLSAGHSLEALLQQALDEVGALTDSPVGFWHFVGADHETPALQTWSNRALRAAGQGRPPGADAADAWAECLRQRRVVIQNDATPRPPREGAPPVLRALVVPIFRQDRIVAVLGMGNKPRAYTAQDVEVATFMADVAWEIAERKRTEESQARLATAVEQAAEAIVITDANAVMLYANPAFERITGYTRQEAHGQNPRLLKSGHHDAEFYRRMRAVLTAGGVWSGRLINKRKDGTLYEEDATISPVRDAAGTIVNYVAVKRDVSREVALEAQNRQAAKMEAVGKLAGGVAHDFNNKIQIILGSVEIIRYNLPPDHPIQADVQEIQNAARRSADLTRQLLAFSRQQAIAPMVLDVNAMITGSLKMLGRLIGENIQLNFAVARDDWSVFMDPGQLDQLLANLAVNARDAIAGTGTISIAATSRTLQEADCRAQPDFVPPGDYVVLTFRDDGAGMAPEIQTHIFEPFFTTKGVGKGTGLGLATVYGIIKQNHGAITVQSAPGQGTTFSIYLPRSSETACAAESEVAEGLPTGTETVLVVEDEECLLNQVHRSLTLQGYKVLSASTPRLALQAYTQCPDTIHLLLTDVIMPEKGGKELSESLQKLCPDIRVLYMSGYPVDTLEQQGHLPRGVQVLPKPFTSAVLAQRVRAALDAPAALPAT
jgi:PAS domain S-box-containing protein